MSIPRSAYQQHSTHTHGAREVRFRLALFPVSQSAPIVLHNDRRYRWLWPIVTAVINRCVFIAKAGSAAEHTVATSNVTTAVAVVAAAGEKENRIKTSRHSWVLLDPL